jgi:hypothetical protein
MTHEREIERLLDAWFSDGPTQAPDRVIDVVADRIGRQTQRPGWRLDWRHTTMTPVKIGAAIAAVAIIAVVGYNLLPGPSSNVGGPAAAPSPAPIPSPSASPTSYTWPGDMAPGTYTTRFIWDTPFSVTLTVPEGWQSRDIEVIKDPTLAVAFNLVGNVYQDPCGQVLRSPSLGGSVDELAEALSTMTGIDATAPVPVTLSGYPGTYVEFDVREDIDCAPSDFRIWDDPADSYLPVGPKGPPYWTAEQPNHRVWILDVDGVRYVVSALSSDRATPADLAELQAVIDSIHIGPVRAPSTTQPPQPAAP